MRLVEVDRLAEARGLGAGLTLAEARAMCPDLVVVEADPAEDEALIVRLADAARRFTPLVAIEKTRAEGMAGLVLDIAGCAHLFGGEKTLVAEAVARLSTPHRPVLAAVAATPGAAIALARHRPGVLLPEGLEAEALAPLPLSALRLPAHVVTSMGRVGLKRVGDILALPRAPLAARFGEASLDLLDRALGQLGEPITPRLPTGPYLAERRFAEPIGREADVLRAARRLAETLSTMLETHGEGARRVELSLFRVDGLTRCVEAGLGRPSRDAAFITALFAERLAALADPLDPGFGYDMIRLSVIEAAALAPAQVDLAGGSGGEDLARLVDRLGARLGPGRVQRLAPVEAHLPEESQRVEPAGRPGRIAAAWPAPAAPGEPPTRPIRLFERPERIEVVASTFDGPPLQFRWRRVLHEVAAAEGPERIAPPWWRAEDAGPTRDYYRVEDERGLRFWLYREAVAAPEAALPVWYVHGLFA